MPQSLDIRPNLVASSIGVDRRDTRIRVSQSTRQSIDSVPVDLQARGNDEMLVCKRATTCGRDRRLLGLEAFDVLRDVNDAFRE